MTDLVELRKLFIGNIDGEIESTRDNFEQLFYTKNSKFNQLIDTDRFIISGRKGTGKTILSKYIFNKLNKEAKISCKIFTRHDFNLQKLIDLEYRSLQKEELVLFWKWTFLVQLGSGIIETYPLRSRIPFSNEYKLKKFFSKKYPEDIFKLKEFSKSSQKRTNLAGKVGQQGLNVSSSVESSNILNQSFIKTEYYETISRLERLVFDCMSNNKDTILIYDDLDELEDRTVDDTNYYQVLISMIETIKNLNIQFKKNNNIHSKIIILLRSDIIDDLHKYSSNSNKLITESKTDLYWISKNYDNPEDHPLMEMILNKIRITVPSYSNLNNSHLYKLLFPKKIDGKEIIDYLINYSYGRPRDIIRYLTIVMDKFPDEKHFEPHQFQECAQEYSKWFYNELENEISISRDKNMLLDSLRLINDLKRRTFSIVHIERYYLLNKENYPHINDLKNCIRALYKYGVIGNSWLHSRRKNKNFYHFSWGYRDDANSEPTFSQTFVVHYALRKYFSL